MTHQQEFILGEHHRTLDERYRLSIPGELVELLTATRSECFLAKETCLAGGEEVSSTGEHAREALEVIMGFHVSSKLSGQWVSLPLEDEDRNLEVMMG